MGVSHSRSSFWLEGWHQLLSALPLFPPSVCLELWPSRLPASCLHLELGCSCVPAGGHSFFFFSNEVFLEGDGKLPGFCRSYLGGSDVSRAGAGQGELALPGGAWQR